MRFNGTARERISVAEVKQIAGRAGRYRTAYQDKQAQTNTKAAQADPKRSTQNVGFVTCIDDQDLPYIQKSLEEDDEPIKAAGILPPIYVVEDYAARLPKGLPFEYVVDRLCDDIKIHPRFMLCDLKDQLGIIRAVEGIQKLTPGQRYTIAASPADPRSDIGRPILEAYARCVAEGRSVTIADIPEIPLEMLEVPLSADREYLQKLEALHKSLILFLWLSYRFVNVFKDQAMAFHAKELAEEKINATLLEFSANPKLRRQYLARRKSMDSSSPHTSVIDIVESIGTSEPRPGDNLEADDISPPPPPGESVEEESEHNRPGPFVYSTTASDESVSHSSAVSNG